VRAGSSFAHLCAAARALRHAITTHANNARTPRATARDMNARRVLTPTHLRRCMNASSRHLFCVAASPGASRANLSRVFAAQHLALARIDAPTCSQTALIIWIIMRAAKRAARIKLRSARALYNSPRESTYNLASRRLPSLNVHSRSRMAASALKANRIK